MVWQATKISQPKNVKSVVYSNKKNLNLTGPPDIEEAHQILGAGGPLGQCFRKLICNPDYMCSFMVKSVYCARPGRY